MREFKNGGLVLAINYLKTFALAVLEFGLSSGGQVSLIN